MGLQARCAIAIEREIFLFMLMGVQGEKVYAIGSTCTNCRTSKPMAEGPRVSLTLLTLHAEKI